MSIGAGQVPRDPKARPQQRRANATTKSGLQFTYAVIDQTDSPYDLPLNIDILYADSSAGNVTVNLYKVSSFAERNELIHIKNTGSANNVSVTPQSGETIDGVAGPRTVASQGHIILAANPSGTNWSRFSA